MKVDNKLLNTKLPGIIYKFEPKNFNHLSFEEKQNLSIEFANLIANIFNVKNCNICFVGKEVLNNDGALFSFNDNKIYLNKEIFNRNVDTFDIAILLDNIIHETIHYCQKENLFFLEHLKNPLPIPYKTLQPHEIEAYELSSKILNECKKYLNNDLEYAIEYINQYKISLKDKHLNDLKERGYNTSKFSINNQIKLLIPFYENIFIIQNFEENNKLTLNFNKSNQNINAAYINDNDLIGTIKINNNGEINKLQFSIIKNICFINEIIKEDKQQFLQPVSFECKCQLINILNKIIEIGNINNFFKCKKYKINPISIVENKKEYDNFIKEVKNGNIKLAKNVSLISENEIENNIFKINNDR